MLTNLIEIIILSLIQGVSEFLPISSSAHLIVVSTLYEFKSSSLAELRGSNDSKNRKTLVDYHLI